MKISRKESKHLARVKQSTKRGNSSKKNPRMHRQVKFTFDEVSDYNN